MSQILLIEPDRLLAETYKKALKTAGHKVSVASGSQEAINLADNISPDLIILEIQLVGHSGIEFLYEFRSYPEWQNIPVIIHTSVPYAELANGWPILSGYLNTTEYRYKPNTTLESLISSVNDLALTT